MKNYHPKYTVTTEDPQVPPPREVSMILTEDQRESVSKAREFLRSNPGFRKAGFVVGKTPDGRGNLVVVVTADDAWLETEAARDTEAIEVVE